MTHRVLQLALLLCLGLTTLSTNSDLRAQTITLLPGNNIADSTVIASGTTVDVQGGSIGLDVDLANGVLNISSGQVAIGASGTAGPTSGFTNSNNQVNLSGGTVGGFFQLLNGTSLDVTGGQIESFGVFGAGTTADISGGTVTRFPDIFSGGVVDISGGDVAFVRVFGGGELNLFGTGFAIDGVALSLSPGVQTIVNQRNVTLSGTLGDGSFFTTDLSTAFGGFFSDNPSGAAADALITVTAVPEPASPLCLLVGGFLLAVRRQRKPRH